MQERPHHTIKGVEKVLNPAFDDCARTKRAKIFKQGNKDGLEALKDGYKGVFIC